jgi:Zn-dependent protease
MLRHSSRFILPRFQDPLLIRAAAAAVGIVPQKLAVDTRTNNQSISQFTFFTNQKPTMYHLNNTIAIRSLSTVPPPKLPPTNKWRNAGALAATGAVLFGKTKYVLAALKLTKLAPLASMVVSIGGYTLFFGFPYAVGLVGLILVHECGHAAVMHHFNMEFTPMVFLPFMGAVIAMKNQPRSAWEDALVALGGPVLGSVGAAGVAGAAVATDSQLMYALADFGFMINLFNLMPLGSMDGGRIAGALSPWFGVAGIGMCGTMVANGLIHNPLVYLILLSGSYETFMRFYDPSRMPPNYYKISKPQRAAIGASYFGLIGTLLAAMSWSQQVRKSPEVLKEEREREMMFDMRS